MPGIACDKRLYLTCHRRLKESPVGLIWKSPSQWRRKNLLSILEQSFQQIPDRFFWKRKSSSGQNLFILGLDPGIHAKLHIPMDDHLYYLMGNSSRLQKRGYQHIGIEDNPHVGEPLAGAGSSPSDLRVNFRRFHPVQTPSARFFLKSLQSNQTTCLTPNSKGLFKRLLIERGQETHRPTLCRQHKFLFFAQFPPYLARMKPEFSNRNKPHQ